MADQEEDFSSLPLPDRFTHKVWKVRKQAYEQAIDDFSKSPDEQAPVFRPFILDSALWKSAVADSNVAAQQEGIAALCAFLKFGGKEACVRSRPQTITPLYEKGLSSTRAATKASALEALLLYIEIDASGPVIEDMLPGISHKQPKVIAACIAALTAIYHNYGCKIVDPKPVLKMLPKMFGHADKNVRAEATNLAVEFYRWLREAMKPTFWNDLKPTQQTDLEAQFEKIKAEPAPKQERLLRSQQDAPDKPQGADGGDGYDGDDGDADEPAEVDAFDLAEPQDVYKKIPADFSDALASSKWKDRKEGLEALYAVVNVPRIKDADFSEVNRILAKCMKDANVLVVVQAAQCIEALAKGLRSAYGKYKPTVMLPILDRLKEKKQTISDALAAALDQVFLATSFTECLEDVISYLTNKNPQVKEGTMRFLIRCLRTTRTVPSKAEITTVVESAKKLLSESSEVLRSGGCEILGTVMKIIGERAMNQHLEGLDEIRKTKTKEFFETAEVKAKDKPKPPPPAPAARAPAGGPPKRLAAGAAGARKLGAPAAAAGAKKPAAVTSPVEDSAPLAPQPTSRSGAPGKLGLTRPGVSTLKKRTIGGPTAAAAAATATAPVLASPRKPAAAAKPMSPEFDEDPEIAAPPPPSQPRLGMGRGGLAGRSLAKPAAAPAQPVAPMSPVPSYGGMSAMDRAELEELRNANDRLLRQIEEMRYDRNKLLSEVQELKNQNASLIEDHTRDVLSIKAKETQLVRARSDAEATEQTNERLRREMDRLKKALSRAEGLGISGGVSPGSPAGISSPTREDMIGGAGSGAGGGGGGGGGFGSRPMSRQNSNFVSGSNYSSEEKENGGTNGTTNSGTNGDSAYPRSKLSPDLRYAGATSSSLSGRGSPARTYRNMDPFQDDSQHTGSGSDSGRPASTVDGSGGVENWKRAAEVTSQLRARIEQMKAKKGFSRP